MLCRISGYLQISLSSFQNKNAELNGEHVKRIHNLCEDGIENLSLWITIRHDVMPNSDGFYYPTLTLMIDSNILHISKDKKGIKEEINLTASISDGVAPSCWRKSRMLFNNVSKSTLAFSEIFFAFMASS